VTELIIRNIECTYVCVGLQYPTVLTNPAWIVEHSRIRDIYYNSQYATFGVGIPKSDCRPRRRSRWRKYPLSFAFVNISGVLN